MGDVEGTTQELTLLYVHGEEIGYGRYGSKLAEYLPRIGVDVYDHLDAGDEPSKLSARLLEREGQRSKRTNVVCWVSVPSHARRWWAGQYAVVSTMWEATVLPESFRSTLHHFDQIIVPSEHNVELFGKYHPNVSYVPLGVEPRDWHQTARPSMDTREFRFLIGGSGARKGTDLAYRAFLALWGDDDSWPVNGPAPVLVMKNPKGEQFDPHPRVRMIAGRLDPDEEIALYETAHCYVQPSRGEGFGLQPLQAIAQGCPTILTDAHGHAAFAWLGLGLSSKLAPAAYFIYGDAGEWWEPDFDELCDTMRWVYENYDDALTHARHGAEYVHGNLTWKHTARQFVTAIGNDRLTAPYSGDNTVYVPEQKRYLVRVRVPWTADIAGTMYRFEPGHDYYELADVKRILFEAGRLDPSCLTAFMVNDDVQLDVGLTQSQAERIPAYTAANSYCPTCLQRLNTRPTRSDDLFRMEGNRP